MQEHEELSIMQRALVLMEVQPFKDLPAEDIALIAARTGEARFDAGAVLTPEDSDSEGMFVIVEGAVELSIDGRVVRCAGSGESFGLSGIVGSSQPGEQFKVVAPTHALRLTRADFEQTVADYPQFALALIRALIMAIRQLPTDAGAEAHEH